MEPLAFRERNWKRLLTEIEQGCVVPVIGPELLSIRAGDRDLPLYQYLALELAKRLEVKVPENASLTEVVWAYRELSHGDASEPYYEVWDILKGLKFPTPQPLQILAGIEPLRLFITTTFDGLMAQAINEARYSGEVKTAVRVYRKPGPGDDINGVESQPLVYHLFGQANTLPTFVLTDEDLLEFAHLWQDQDHRPMRLRSLLADKYLLMLGCSFPDWLSRFILCALKYDTLFEKGNGRRGVIADDRSRSDQRLTHFLSRCSTQIYPDGSGIEFVRELGERWKEHVAQSTPAVAQPGARVNEPRPTAEPSDVFVNGSIFISYASEDRAAAEKIKNALEAAGLDVWFDRKQLEIGDDYRAKILKNIEQSSFFMPILSQHVLTPERRFFRLEWSHALDESRLRPTGIPFVMPVAIDQTPPEDPLLPPEFGQIQWERLAGGAPGEEFVALCRRRIRSLRRQEVKA